jgi:hypothetical protein
MKQQICVRACLLSILAILCSAAPARAGLTFNFSYLLPTPVGVQNAFEQAGDIWSQHLLEDVTVNIAVGFWTGSNGVALADGANYSYSQVRSSLIQDAKSDTDFLAIDHLQPGPALSFRINRTANSPFGAGSATTYIDNDGDANNTQIAITHANAKSLGLRDAHDPGRDAVILIHTDYRDLGTAPVRLALHEIGHALGFLSGVDALDTNSSPGNMHDDDWFTYVSTMDLYRYSVVNPLLGTSIMDWSADTRDKYFSLDGGQTKIASFARGDTWGNSIQASHWHNSGTGVMSYGPNLVTLPDIQVLDAIGWDTVLVPEPATWLLAALALAGSCFSRRKRPPIA